MLVQYRASQLSLRGSETKITTNSANTRKFLHENSGILGEDCNRTGRFFPLQIHIHRVRYITHALNKASLMKQMCLYQITFYTKFL